MKQIKSNKGFKYSKIGLLLFIIAALTVQQTASITTVVLYGMLAGVGAILYLMFE